MGLIAPHHPILPLTLAKPTGSQEQGVSAAPHTDFSFWHQNLSLASVLGYFKAVLSGCMNGDEMFMSDDLDVGRISNIHATHWTSETEEAKAISSQKFGSTIPQPQALIKWNK